MRPLHFRHPIGHNDTMRYLDLTLPTAAENLALDEALLETAEAAGQPLEMLRFWEAAGPMVVVGRSSHLNDEVLLEACRADNVPVLRRPSGGAAVVTGPGCLMYALVLSYEKRPHLKPLENAHRFVLDTLTSALAAVRPGVRCAGTSDLAIEDDGIASREDCNSATGIKKFSGNSVRCCRTHFLYHGTLLYDFPLEQVARYLKHPPRTPGYRNDRHHSLFVTNLGVSAKEIRRALIAAWDATEPCSDWPCELTARLAAEKYSQAVWNECR
jgi:lipoate---protein ligase